MSRQTRMRERVFKMSEAGRSGEDKRMRPARGRQQKSPGDGERDSAQAMAMIGNGGEMESERQCLGSGPWGLREHKLDRRFVWPSQAKLPRCKEGPQARLGVLFFQSC